MADRDSGSEEGPTAPGDQPPEASPPPKPEDEDDGCVSGLDPALACNPRQPGSPWVDRTLAGTRVCWEAHVDTPSGGNPVTERDGAREAMLDVPTSRGDLMVILVENPSTDGGGLDPLMGKPNGTRVRIQGQITTIQRPEIGALPSGGERCSSVAGVVAEKVELLQGTAGSERGATHTRDLVRDRDVDLAVYNYGVELGSLIMNGAIYWGQKGELTTDVSRDLEYHLDELERRLSVLERDGSRDDVLRAIGAARTALQDRSLDSFAVATGGVQEAFLAYLASRWLSIHYNLGLLVSMYSMEGDASALARLMDDMSGDVIGSGFEFGGGYDANDATTSLILIRAFCETHPVRMDTQERLKRYDELNGYVQTFYGKPQNRLQLTY